MRALFQTTFITMLLASFGIAQTSTPDVNTIVTRMQAAMAGRNHDRAYSVTREYRLVPEDPSKASRVVAEVNSLPSGKKDYTIKEGSGQAESVVKKVLDHETEAPNQHAVSEISAASYDFMLTGMDNIDGHRCYVLQLNPKREGKEILKGQVWVDAENYLVRQVAGTPTKSPSWWIKDVQVKLHYADIQGVWLQDSSEAVAQVRLVGKHTLTQRALNVRAEVAVASRAKPEQAEGTRKRHRRLDPALLGAGVFQQR
jgi:hypothetical protein